MNINSILETATRGDIWSARENVANLLHLNYDEVPAVVAVAYIQKHYGEGRIGGPEVQGWEGFIADGVRIP